MAIFVLNFLPDGSQFMALLWGTMFIFEPALCFAASAQFCASNPELITGTFNFSVLHIADFEC